MARHNVLPSLPAGLNLWTDDPSVATEPGYRICVRVELQRPNKNECELGHTGFQQIAPYNRLFEQGPEPWN
jgi:hypothetical protein